MAPVALAVRAAFKAVTSVATESSTAHWVTLGKICTASVSSSTSQLGGSTPVTPVRESESSARAVRARARAVIVARQQTAQTELDQLEQLEQRHETALNSPSPPTVERELRDIEGELQRIVLSAGLPVSPMRVMRRQLVLTESEEQLVEAADTAVQNSMAASAKVQNSAPAAPTMESAAAKI